MTVVELVYVGQAVSRGVEPLMHVACDNGQTAAVPWPWALRGDNDIVAAIMAFPVQPGDVVPVHDWRQN
ncbi:hypothetical protein LCGC14_1917470 [marine sediment metagenome]|uniref:Uncharacterized protein n=1 Tax=marine sediment metagenome TaxID=412755 RepID=A0A0F9GF34_9ZZZZ